MHRFKYLQNIGFAVQIKVKAKIQTSGKHIIVNGKIKDFYIGSYFPR